MIEGTQSTYLIVIGDQGLNHGSGRNWNVGSLFALAAQQKANDLQSQGHRVIVCRATTVQDLNNEMTTNGLIDGGVIYFGHAGEIGITDAITGKKTYYSSVFIGQDPIINENLYSGDVNLLSNAHLGSNATITFNGCDAGIANGQSPIAQLVANQLQRSVFGYPTGLYFSPLDAAHETETIRQKAPSDLPVYLVPIGHSGHKPPPILFRPQ